MWFDRQQATRPRCRVMVMKTFFGFVLVFSSTMNGPVLGQLIIAHRGASYDAPENTLAAFHLAWEQQADGIEGDFRLTRDGKIVCIHDATTERTAGDNLNVANCTLAELKQLDVGNWKDQRFAGQRIPTLQEVIETVPEGRTIVIELKTGPEIVRPLQAVIRESNLELSQVFVISFNEQTIAETKRRLPGVKTHWLSGYQPREDRPPYQPTAEAIGQTVRQTGADGFGSQGRRAVFDEKFQKSLKRHGVKEFHVWTVDEPEDAKFFQKLGACGITTNRPALIRDALSEDD